MAVPLIHKIQSALLYPSVKIVLSNLVGVMKDAIVRSQYCYRSLFNRYPPPAQFSRVRSEVTFVEISWTGFVLHDQRSAVINKIQQLLIVGREILLRIVSADSQNDCLILAQIFACDFVRGN